MNDEEFLDYCNLHSRTPRCGFTPSQLGRLCMLAGLHTVAEQWLSEAPRVVNCDRESIRSTIIRARRNQIRLVKG